MSAPMGGGIFKSINEEQPKPAVNSGLTTAFVFALAIDPSAPVTLYAGTTGAGVLKSVDGGNGWATINSGLTVAFVYALAIDPSNPATLYTGTGVEVSSGALTEERAGHSQAPASQLQICSLKPWRSTPLLPPRSMPGPAVEAPSRAPTEEFFVLPPILNLWLRTRCLRSLAIESPRRARRFLALLDRSRRLQEHERRKHLDVGRQVRPDYGSKPSRLTPPFLSPRLTPVPTQTPVLMQALQEHQRRCELGCRQLRPYDGSYSGSGDRSLQSRNALCR